MKDEAAAGLAVWGEPGLLVYLVADAVCFGAALLLAWLFFHRIWLCIAVPIGVPLLHRMIRGRWKERQMRRFRLEFRDALQQLQSYLQAGRSMENAMLLTAGNLKETEGGILWPEWNRMVSQLQMHLSIEYVWADLAEKNPVAEVRQFAEVISAVRRSGGSMVQVIQTAIHEITLLIQTEEEVAGIVTAQKMQMYVLEAVPVGLLLFLNSSAPDLLEPMYSTLMGQVIMGICLGVYVGAAALGNWISDIKV